MQAYWSLMTRGRNDLDTHRQIVGTAMLGAEFDDRIAIRPNRLPMGLGLFGLLVTHMPVSEHMITAKQVNDYATPVVEQAINQVVQVTPLERVNEKIHEIGDVVHSHLQDFLKAFGITLDTVKVLIFPRDERMRALISLRAFGLQEIDAVRHYIAMLMAEHGLVSAPNMAIGEPFHIGAPVQATVGLGGISRGPSGG